MHFATQTPSKLDKGKGREGTPEPTRSITLHKLDELLTSLCSPSSSKSPSPLSLRPSKIAPETMGAFAKVRLVSLSYLVPISHPTPLCGTFSLILCALHAPYRPFPHHATVPLLALTALPLDPAVPPRSYSAWRTCTATSICAQ